MKNQMVADILYQIADLLDIKGEIFLKQEPIVQLHKQLKF